MGEDLKKVLVISGVNFFEGGPLSLMKDCLRFLDSSIFSDEYRVIALVHKVDLYSALRLQRIELIEFPFARNNYILRLWLEFFYFRRFAVRQNVHFWLSMHDITPNVGDVSQAVYCHNPAPFYETSWKDVRLDFKFFLFAKFYKLLYRTNITRNKSVIVQQSWLRDEFVRRFGVSNSKIIVAHPEIAGLNKLSHDASSSDAIVFFFPTLPRVFKNVEVLAEACKLIAPGNRKPFRVIVTIKGDENKYARYLFKKYSSIKEINFIGKLSREEVFNVYKTASCLVFPSKLETWGLPLTEFKATGKVILAADLPYSHETIGDYRAAAFFKPTDSRELSRLMSAVINKDNTFPGSIFEEPQPPYASGWKTLFNKLLN